MRRNSPFYRQCAAFVLGVTVLLPAAESLAGEKIQAFKPEKETTELPRTPTRGIGADSIRAPESFFRDSNPMPMPAPTPSIILMPDRRTFEQRDRAKNWIFLRPEVRDAKSGADEAFKVKGLDAWRDQKSESVISQYFQGKDSSTPNRNPAALDPNDDNANLGSQTDANRNLRGSSFRDEKQSSSDRSGFDRFSKSAGNGSIFDNLEANRPSMVHDQWRLEHGLHAATPDAHQFQRVYEYPALQNRGARDPVNLIDSSRQPANPTTAASDYFDRAREASKYDPYAGGGASSLHRMQLDDRT